MKLEDVLFFHKLEGESFYPIQIPYGHVLKNFQIKGESPLACFWSQNSIKMFFSVTEVIFKQTTWMPI